MQRARAGRLLHLPGCWLVLWLLVAATERSLWRAVGWLHAGVPVLEAGTVS